MITSTAIETFTDEEQEIIKAAIEKLREKRRYSDRPKMFHDFIMDGCRKVLDGQDH